MHVEIASNGFRPGSLVNRDYTDAVPEKYVFEGERHKQ